MASKSWLKSGTVDIYEIIFEHARNYPFPEETKLRIDFDNLDATCVDESNLRFYNRPSEQTPCAKSDKALTSSLPDKPLAKCLASFTNSTKTQQTQNIKLAEQNVTTCRLKTTKFVNKCGNISTQIELPNVTIQVGWGFPQEKTLTPENEWVMETKQCVNDTVSARFNTIFPLMLQKPHNHVKPFTPMHIALHVKLGSCSGFVADTQPKQCRNNVIRWLIFSG